MEEAEKKGEEQATARSSVIEPAFKALEGQRILDYNNEEHREQITKVLYRHFDEGRTDNGKVLRIVSSPRANPRIINVNEHLIGSHRGMHSRWCKKEENTGIEVIEGKREEENDELETFKQDVEGGVSVLKNKVESMEDLLYRRRPSWRPLTS